MASKKQRREEPKYKKAEPEDENGNPIPTATVNATVHTSDIVTSVLKDATRDTVGTCIHSVDHALVKARETRAEIPYNQGPHQNDVHHTLEPHPPQPPILMPFPLSTKYAQTSVPPLTRDAYYDVSSSYTRAARTHVARRSMAPTTAEAQPYWPPPSTSAPEHYMRSIDLNEASSSSRSSSTRWEPHSIWSPTSSTTAQTSSKTLLWSSVAPPPHSRPLYQTIPLPTEDTVDNAKAVAVPTTMSPTSPPPTTPWSMLLAPWPDSSPHANYQQFDHTKATSAQLNPIQLHPILQKACLSSSLSVLNHLSQLSTDGAPDRSAPATNPSLGYLSIMITRYGATMPVHPSPSNPFVVTVGDVLDALYKVADIIMNEENDGQNVRGGGRGQKGERRSSGGWEGRTRVLESLKLCWRTSTGNRGTEAGSHMGQLVVECR